MFKNSNFSIFGHLSLRRNLFVINYYLKFKHSVLSNYLKDLLHFL